MPEIEVLSDTEATGMRAMEDIVEFTDSVLHGDGHYHETYAKGWRRLAGRQAPRDASSALAAAEGRLAA